MDLGASEKSLEPTPSSSLKIIEKSTPMPRKRESSLRRLSALRGLVASLDFNQPWSNTNRSEEDMEDEILENDEGEGFVVFAPVKLLETPMRMAKQSVTGLDFFINDSISHGWPSPPDRKPQRISESKSVWTTPSRPNDPRKALSTPPRRHSKASSDLPRAKTPDPQRTFRRDVFDVASAGFNKSMEMASPTREDVRGSWRSSLRNEATYGSVLQLQGPMEIKRQEIMWEMIETEDSFIKSMRTVLRLFATPLKTPHGNWIDGIAPRITDLFDCLENILHNHQLLLLAEQDLRKRADSIVITAFVATLAKWQDRLLAYEWYLLHFEEVVQMVEESVQSPNSVFGEFVRMQLKDEVLGSMGLGSMLLKPVQRLTKYPLFLKVSCISASTADGKRLLDVTFSDHSVHVELTSLLVSVEFTITKLQDLKVKEDEFRQLKQLKSRIIGLPAAVDFAIRGRRLLGHAQIVTLTDKELGLSRADSLYSSRGSILSASSANTGSLFLPFESAHSASTCRTSTFSISSTSTPSRSNSLTSSQSFASLRRPSLARAPSSCSTTDSSGGSSTRSPARSKKRDSTISLFIFNDMVIVAKPESGSLFGNKKERGWKVLPDSEGGVGRIIEVEDWSGWHGKLYRLARLTTGCESLVSITIEHHTAATPSTVTKAISLLTLQSPKTSVLPGLSIIRSPSQLLSAINESMGNKAKAIFGDYAIARGDQRRESDFSLSSSEGRGDLDAAASGAGGRDPRDYRVRVLIHSKDTL